MRDPLNRVESISRGFDLGRIDEEPEVQEQEEPTEEVRPDAPFWVRIGERYRAVWAVLSLVVGIAGTGFVGKRVLSHAHEVQDALPTHLNLLDYFFSAFLILCGVLVGLAVAGMIVRRTWGLVSLGVLGLVLGMSLLFAASMREQFDAFSSIVGNRCVPVTMAPNGVAPTGKAAICTPAEMITGSNEAPAAADSTGRSGARP